MTMVSIAMATYNGERYLCEQLASLASQTLLPDELVVTDDGSTDATLSIIGEYAKSSPFRVRIERNATNLGYARNFQKAAQLCRGDLVFFCDQDDRWDEDKIEVMVASFARSPEMMVLLCDARLCDGELRDGGRTQYHNLRDVGLADFNYVMGCASANRRQWIDVLLPLPPGRTHDFWLNQTAHLAGVARILDRPLQDYRRHGSNESQTPLSNPDGVRVVELLSGHGFADVRKQWGDMIETLQIMIDRLNDNLAASKLSSKITKTAIARLEKRIEAYGRRIAVCSVPRWRRMPQLAQMWLRGDYRQFMGLHSLAKDLIRP